ncbi:MAG: hypothetical protein M5U12_13310 [Verrucomicrobia bacterium]|nr:hypothetical protein [Verrucomicrobiota bacterium]
MSSRERVLAALNHQRPDRTPRDFWAEPPAWNRLLRHLGHHDRERVLTDLGIDLRHLEAAPPPRTRVPARSVSELLGRTLRLSTDALGPDARRWQRRAGRRPQSGGAGSLPPGHTPDDLDRSRLAAQCRAHDDHALLYGFADVWQRPALVRGWEEFLVDLVERPDWVHWLCRRFTDFYIEDYTRAAELTRGRIDLYLLISDLGTQHGPLISLPMFRAFAAPYLREMITCIHGLRGRVLFHSCGSVQDFIPDLIALGVDVLDPIQPTGPAMAPEALQAAFGGRLAFHGGMDMQRLLPSGTPGEVAAEAARYCEIPGGRGGYILGPAHLFQPDVPPENILAMYGG